MIITTLFNKFKSITQSSTPIWLLLIRITIGLIFIQTGLGKLQNITETTAFFSQLGIPLPYINAVIASLTEFIGGIALVIGVATRPAAMALVIVMCVALLTAHLPEIHTFSDFLIIQDLDYILLLGILLSQGAGKFSIDYILTQFSRYKR
jgi:putative oxidoreductase